MQTHHGPPSLTQLVPVFAYRRRSAITVTAVGLAFFFYLGLAMVVPESWPLTGLVNRDVTPTGHPSNSPFLPFVLAPAGAVWLALTASITYAHTPDHLVRLRWGKMRETIAWRDIAEVRVVFPEGKNPEVRRGFLVLRDTTGESMTVRPRWGQQITPILVRLEHELSQRPHLLSDDESGKYQTFIARLAPTLQYIRAHPEHLIPVPPHESSKA